MGKCNLCPEEPADDELLDHLRVMHPDVWEPVETWPDGGVVIVDQTLAPDEFR